MNSLTPSQKTLCAKYGAQYLPCDDYLKIGISKNFDSTIFPINGIRHSPARDTTGWYIWSGEQFSSEPDFFVPIHLLHLNDRCSEIVKYLGLGPGWRFLFSPNQEDVWFDEPLLRI
ncbi:MAG TPA: hypothetical protein VGG66_03315 [Rhizomicrobium sp.]|jgi:hypothetical protein